jgi:hypothetical protein
MTLIDQMTQTLCCFVSGNQSRVELTGVGRLPGWRGSGVHLQDQLRAVAVPPVLHDSYR